MDPLLPLLAIDVVALLLVAALPTAVPLAVRGFVASGLCGLGALSCLLPLLLRLPAMTLTLPAGPPGLSLHLVLDAFSMCFLTLVFLAGAVILLFQTSAVPGPPGASIRLPLCCLAGAALALLAADGVSLTLGITVACSALWRPWSGPMESRPWQLSTLVALLVPLLLLAAVCLLTPAGFAPRFDMIRASPVDPERAMAAAVLTVGAVAGLAVSRSTQRCRTRDALVAGVLFPAASYLLLRMLADLPGSSAANWWGLALLLIGGAIAVVEGWLSAADPDLDAAVASLVRRQMGLAITGVGLSLLARAADLPEATSFAVAAVLFLAIGTSVAGVLATLAAHTLGASAGSFRLSRLGGLIHTMPVTSAAMAAGLLGLTAVPPGAGFASMWLLFSAILSAPRGDGLLVQLPLALGSAAIAVSAALATVACVRLIGIAILGRPRTPRGSSAQESGAPIRTILLGLSGLSALAGILPGPTLWLLGDPVIDAFTGGPPEARIALAVLWNGPNGPGYLALPVLALLVLSTWAVLLAAGRSRKGAKPAGIWADGMPPPAGLPFGDPEAQSAGAGFLPQLLDPRRLPNPSGLSDLSALRVPWLPALRPPTFSTGLWLLLGGFGALLVALAVAG